MLFNLIVGFDVVANRRARTLDVFFPVSQNLEGDNLFAILPS